MCALSNILSSLLVSYRSCTEQIGRWEHWASSAFMSHHWLCVCCNKRWKVSSMGWRGKYIISCHTYNQLCSNDQWQCKFLCHTAGPEFSLLFQVPTWEHNTDTFIVQEEDKTQPCSVRVAGSNLLGVWCHMWQRPLVLSLSLLLFTVSSGLIPW